MTMPTGRCEMQIISLDYNSYVGKIGVGRINRGRMRGNMDVAFRFGPDGEVQRGRINFR